MSVLKVSGLHQAYGSLWVLRDLSFSLEAGEFVVLAGPNGVGKSTLLRTLVGLHRPASGEVRWWNKNPYSDERNEITARIGYVGSESMLYEELSIRENLLFFSMLYKLKDAETRAAEICERLGLLASWNKELRTCSLGTERRASIARALLHSPEGLVLDEPFANLDPTGREGLSALLDELASTGTTLLMASNDPQIQTRHGKRRIELLNGRLAEGVR